MPNCPIYPAPAERTHALRHAVLRPHQALGAMAYPGDDDPATIHLAAIDPVAAGTADAVDGGAVVGIVSLYVEPMPDDARPGDWRLRGMAVDPVRQGGGIGTALIQAGLAAARDAGATRVWCNARTPAAGFYDHAGFQRKGDPFDLPGIGEHYVMWIAI